MKDIKDRQQTPLWTPWFILIMMISFLTAISYQLQITTLPLYVQHIGGSESAAGLMLGAFTLSALLFCPLSGNLEDRKGRKIMLVIGIGIFTLASFTYIYIQIVWLLVIMRFIHGIGFSASSTSSGNLLHSGIIRILYIYVKK